MFDGFNGIILESEVVKQDLAYNKFTFFLLKSQMLATHFPLVAAHKVRCAGDLLGA